ncbi:MAG: hypothetical protein J6V80_03310 [Clostridia bacterium]|nr:hypothetical protein [Clostridia bacterium]
MMKNNILRSSILLVLIISLLCSCSLINPNNGQQGDNGNGNSDQTPDNGVNSGNTGDNIPDDKTPNEEVPDENDPSDKGDEPYFKGRQSILLIGRSNMAGRGNLSHVEPISDDRILMQNESLEWVKMEEPIHYDKTAAGVGLAASFAKGFVDTFDCEVGLIPAAYGGTSLAQWKVGGTYYNRALEMARAAQEDSEICAILWHHGGSGDTAYGEKLKAIINGFISDLGLDRDKIVIVTGETCYSVEEEQRNMTHEQLRSLCDDFERYGVASAETLTMNSDNSHFDAASLRVFGYRYFDIFKTFVTGEHFEYVDDPEHYFIGEKRDPDSGYVGPEDDVDPSLTKIEVFGTIEDDTFVSNTNSSAKDADYSTSKTTLGTNSNLYRSYFKFNLIDIIDRADFDPDREDAKIQFIFALSGGEFTDETKITFSGYIPGETTTDVPFSELSWNSLKSDGSHPELNWGSGTKLLDGATLGDKVFYSNGYLTLTFSYSEIADFVSENGDAVFMLRISVTTDIYIASMENTQFASPKVKYVYYQ